MKQKKDDTKRKKKIKKLLRLKISPCPKLKIYKKKKKFLDNALFLQGNQNFLAF